MTMTDAYQITAIVSLAGVSILGLLAAIIAPKGKDGSISGSIASHKILYVAAGIIITSLAGLFCLSLVYWYMPTYSMPGYTILLALLTFSLACLIAWAPADAVKNKRLRDIHFAAGQLLGIVFIFLLATILYSSSIKIPPAVQTVVYLTVGYSLLCYVLYISVPRLRKYFLYFEIPFLAALVLSFLLLALSI